MSDNGDGLRERKKRATRAALNEAAVRLCTEREVQQVTVEQIAEIANVSARTFFNYFATKEEAVVGGDTLGERFRGVLAARPAAESLADALRATVRELLDAMDGEFRDRIEQYLGVVQRNPSLLPYHLAAQQAGERALAEIIAERTGERSATEFGPAVIAACTIAALRVATRRWLEHDGADLATLALRAIDQVADGFAGTLVAG